jgi:drug/metabolite transporter (DMT)-like permease
MVALIMFLFFHEKVSLLTVFCILLALSGIGLLYKGEGGETLSLVGMLLVILSSLSYAVYIVGVNHSTLKLMSTAKLTFYALLFGLSIYIVRLNFCADLQAVPSFSAWGNILIGKIVDSSGYDRAWLAVGAFGVATIVLAVTLNIMDKKQFYLLYEKKEGKAEG